MNKKNNVIEHEACSINDVLLKPRLGVIESRKHAEIMPYIFSAPMDTVTGFDLAQAMLKQNQFPVISRHLRDEEYIACIQEFANNPNVFFAVGMKSDLKSFIEELKKTCSNWDKLNVNVALDVAHGDMQLAHTTTKWLSEKPFINKVMSGSICTMDAAARSIDNGCSFLRIGVGPGAACTTRLMTGCGLPQLSAVYWINKLLTEHTKYDRNDVFLIADGGIKYPGDAVKYMAAGSDYVMLGSLLGNTKESYGWDENGSKSYRGMASKEFQQDRYDKSNDCPEGVSLAVQNRSDMPTVEAVVNYMQGGMRSAISYLGLRSSLDLRPENVEFVRITPSGYVEGTPHGLQ
jgi:IMP dehydrogenase